MSEASAISWKRGFLRLWVLVAFVWMLGILLLAQPWVSLREFAEAKSKLEKFPSNYAKIETDIAAGGRTLDDGKFVDVEQLVGIRERLMERQTELEAVVAIFLERALNFVLLLLGPPIVLFAFGVAISWVFGGFRRRKNSPS